MRYVLQFLKIISDKSVGGHWYRAGKADITREYYSNAIWWYLLLRIWFLLLTFCLRTLLWNTSYEIEIAVNNKLLKIIHLHLFPCQLRRSIEVRYWVCAQSHSSDPATAGTMLLELTPVTREHLRRRSRFTMGALGCSEKVELSIRCVSSTINVQRNYDTIQILQIPPRTHSSRTAKPSVLKGFLQTPSELAHSADPSISKSNEALFFVSDARREDFVG